jgi:hypothetical protein
VPAFDETREAGHAGETNAFPGLQGQRLCRRPAVVENHAEQDGIAIGEKVGLDVKPFPLSALDRRQRLRLASSSTDSGDPSGPLAENDDVVRPPVHSRPEDLPRAADVERGAAFDAHSTDLPAPLLELRHVERDLGAIRRED